MGAAAGRTPTGQLMHIIYCFQYERGISYTYYQKEASMESNRSRRNVAVYRSLHPAVWAAMAGTVVWTVLAVWLIFGGTGDTALSLVVVTFFFAAFMGVPFVLWRASPRAKRVERTSFRTWLQGEFEADRGVISTRDACAMALLLPAAGAVGLTAVSFVAWLAARGAL
jgi:hypothetical protein